MIALHNRAVPIADRPPVHSDPRLPGAAACTQTGDADQTLGGSTANCMRLAPLATILTAAVFLGLAIFLSDGFRSAAERGVAILRQGDAAALRDYIRDFGNLAPAVSLLLMVVQALVAPVPSFIITVANGLAFGVFWGSVLSVAGHALAATVCFGITRAIRSGPVEALVGRAGLAAADRWLARKGPYAVLLARLIPGMAFDAVSYAAGLSRIRFASFLAATVVGTLPQTVFYAYLGHHAPQHAWMLLSASVVVVGGIVVAGLVKRRRLLRQARTMKATSRHPTTETAA
jgi:uncharacterized membrane protein YdjX (TVP38/TMEM64 family)